MGRFNPFCLTQCVHPEVSAGAVRSSGPFCQVPKGIYFYKRVFSVQVLSKLCTGCSRMEIHM